VAEKIKLTKGILFSTFSQTRSQGVARIADRTAKIVGVTWPRPRPLSGKIICAPARHCPHKAAYQIWSL